MGAGEDKDKACEVGGGIMGWGSGSELAENVWRTVRNFIPTKRRKEIASRIIDLFENEDCDTMDEAIDLSRAAGREE